MDERESVVTVARLRRAVNASIAALREDEARGVFVEAEGPITEWATLHDYVDANEYALVGIGAVPEWAGLDDDEWWQAVEAVDYALAAVLRDEPVNA